MAESSVRAPEASIPKAGPIYHLEVEVGGVWKGVHVHNQAAGDGASLVRHTGAGNRVKLVDSTKVPGAFHLHVEVGSEWKTVHVLNQSPDDYANIIRHQGEGNVFKLVKNEQGNYSLLSQVGASYNDWKGTHVHYQTGDDNTRLIRHHSNGNGFRFTAIEEPKKPGDTGGGGGADADKARAELEKKLADQDKARAELEKRIADQDQKIAELAAKADKCGACDEKITAQAKTIEDLGRRLDDLAKKLDEATAKPAIAPAPTPAPAPVVPDSLEAIEGVGPKLAELLKDAGIGSYQALASTSVEELKKILKGGGNKFARTDPSSWPQQAKLASEGKTAELKALQDSLIGGRAKP